MQCLLKLNAGSAGTTIEKRLGQNPGKEEFTEIYHTDFGVISEIQRAKFGVLVTCIFRGTVWVSDMNSGYDIIWRYSRALLAVKFRDCTSVWSLDFMSLFISHGYIQRLHIVVL